MENLKILESHSVRRERRNFLLKWFLFQVTRHLQVKLLTIVSIRDLKLIALSSQRTAVTWRVNKLWNADYYFQNHLTRQYIAHCSHSVAHISSHLLSLRSHGRLLHFENKRGADATASHTRTNFEPKPDAATFKMTISREVHAVIVLYNIQLLGIFLLQPNTSYSFANKIFELSIIFN